MAVGDIPRSEMRHGGGDMIESNAGGCIKKKLRLMVSSAVYGYQEFLDRIYDILTGLGYDVWMSHKGTMPVTSDADTIANCLNAVDSCDVFLGIITTQYGKTERGGKSATHLEFERAVEKNKLRWFLVDDRVMFARQFVKNFYEDNDYTKPVELRKYYFRDMPSFSDMRLLDMYAVAANRHDDDGKPIVNWVQQYSNDDAAILFALSQFSRYQDIESLILKRLGDLDYVKSRLS